MCVNLCNYCIQRLISYSVLHHTPNRLHPAPTFREAFCRVKVRPRVRKIHVECKTVNGIDPCPPKGRNGFNIYFGGFSHLFLHMRALKVAVFCTRSCTVWNGCWNSPLPVQKKKKFKDAIECIKMLNFIILIILLQIRQNTWPLCKNLILQVKIVELNGAHDLIRKHIHWFWGQIKLIQTRLLVKGLRHIC